jgi:hemerythrin-like metal-binding protein
MDQYILPDSCSLPCLEIQAEHELLVSILNKGRNVVRSVQNPDPELFLSLLEELRKTTLAHFAHEEIIMKECGYPDLASHRIHHANCVTRLSQITDMLLAGTVQPGRFLLDELFDMILDDIIRADGGFKAFLGDGNSKCL